MSDENATTARREDANGYWEIEDNPISKVGVFPYLGAQMPGAPDPLKIYMVLRPPEELGAPECVESFRLQPWIIAHEMLGSKEEGLTPPEEKGIHGVIGEKVRFDPETGTLYGNIKGFSEELKAQIEDGVKELSAGYFHDLEWKPGIWNGEAYDAIQRNIRANHLASVRSGRMGPEVAVMDSLTGYDPNIFTIRKDLSMTLEEIAALVKTLLAKLESAESGKTVGTDNDAGTEEGKTAGTDNDGGIAGTDDDPPTLEQLAEVVKAAIGRVDRLTAPAAAGTDNDGGTEEGKTAGTDNDGGTEKAKGMDSAETIQRRILRDLAGRDQLVQKLIPHVGTFDHAEMTGQDVARYGVRKLGLSCKPGQESAVLSGYLTGATKAKATFAMDGAISAASGPSKKLANYLKGGN